MPLALGLLAWALDAATLVRSVLGYVASAVALTALTAVLYRIAVGRQLARRPAVAGALVAAAGFVLVVVGLEVYANVAGNLQPIYGTVAGLVISMLGLWLVVLGVLLGAAVSGGVAERWGDRALAGSP